MTIIDSFGKSILITDLHLAILQADDYRHYTITDPQAGGQEFIVKQQAYWEDVYQKLLLLEREE